MTDYLKLLESSYAQECARDPRSGPENRLDFLGTHIFQFDTDDNDMSARFAKLALDVCMAITDGKTFEFIEDKGRYYVYLWMLNTTWFADRYTCGTSIRGAWWETQPAQKIESCGLWDAEGEQLGEIEFTPEEWVAFVRAMVQFSTGDVP